jgi:hypothetical protein
VTHQIIRVIQKCPLVSKLKHFADPLEAGWSSRKLLKSRKNHDRPDFRQRLLCRSRRASSAAQPPDSPAETMRAHTRVAFLRHPAQIDAPRALHIMP